MSNVVYWQRALGSNDYNTEKEEESKSEPQ